MESNIRVNVSLSPYDYEQLKLWAMTHGKTATAYASHIIAAQLETNRENIKKQLDSFVESRGVSITDLITQISTDEE